MRHYFALIRKEKGSCYGVDFPDFPGCVTAADTVEEAQARAVEVLEMHVDGMVEDGEPLPMATGIDQILEQDQDGFIMAVPIPLPDKKARKVRVDITIPEDLSRQVDRFVQNTDDVNRSSFFAHAGLAHLQRNMAPARAARVKVRSHKKAAKKVIKKAAKAKTSKGK